MQMPIAALDMTSVPYSKSLSDNSMHELKSVGQNATGLPGCILNWLLKQLKEVLDECQAAQEKGELTGSEASSNGSNAPANSADDESVK